MNYLDRHEPSIPLRDKTLSVKSVAELLNLIKLSPEKFQPDLWIKVAEPYEEQQASQIVSILETAASNLSVEIALYISKDRIYASIGHANKVMDLSNIKDLWKERNDLKILHSHRDVFTASVADFLLASRQSPKIAWFCITTNGYYSYKAEGEVTEFLEGSNIEALRLAIKEQVITIENIVYDFTSHLDHCEQTAGELLIDIVFCEQVIESCCSENAFPTDDQITELVNKFRQFFVNEFLNEFEALGYIFRGGTKLESYPVDDMVKQCISANTISSQQLIQLIQKVLVNLVRDKTEVVTSTQVALDMLSRLSALHELDDQIIEEIIMNRNILSQKYKSKIEDLGIINRVLFDQSQVDDLVQFQQKNIATIELDRATLVSMLSE